MAWVKLDDSMPTNPKVLAAGTDGFALDVAAIAYANRYETDGFIADHVLSAVFPPLKNPRKVAARLVEVGRWVRSDGGWLIHGYHDYQPAKEDRERERAEARERMRRVRANKTPRSESVRPNKERSSEEVRVTPSRPVPDPSIEPLPLVEVPPVEVVPIESGRKPDLLWEAARDIWGDPATDTERGRRNKELFQLRKAGVTPEELRFLFGKAVVRWKGEARPGLAGIIRNLGDLRDGVDVSPEQVEEYQDRMRREARRLEAEARTAELRGLPG